MFPISSKPCLLALILLVALPLPALAIPAITCHCFTDRSYDPARPAAADPYFLATTQNSFLALVLNAEKRTIVMKKQKGTSADDLWVAYWLASRTGVSADALLEKRKTKESWKDAVATSGIGVKSLSPQFAKELIAGASSESLAREVVDSLLVDHQLISDAELVAMRKNWASNQEVIIASIIAIKTHKPARQIHLEVKNGKQTWGGLLLAANFDTSALQEEISDLLKMRRMP
ncbi:hypothetical protein [Geobacter argillaceus]|uniref:Uncharacterized protein n=1 Tax=Geobacter argillaceus TaxID=345631 RepID=A0A562VGQ3_9BACT|nr:hypothetical protein [Geobacter argillaceus]TWJ17050.1 hypothetical protein JN12_03162 [Geobacter argillaceus]